MERTAFTLLHDMESSWWYRGRAAVLEGMLKRLPKAERRVLDFGAGYGGMQAVLGNYGEVDAFEPDKEAKAQSKKRAYRKVYDSMDEALAERYDLIGLFDVVEHIEDDAAFLGRLHGSLSEEGHLIITVPAMPFLWSEHDVSHHHYRRYTRASLAKLLRATGYEVERMSYWNFFLFAPAALARLLGRSGESALHTSPFVSSVFLSLIRFEAWLMCFVPLPFGVSLVALARKRRA